MSRMYGWPQPPLPPEPSFFAKVNAGLGRAVGAVAHAIGRGAKAAATTIRFGSRSSWMLLPRSRFNYEREVDPMSNSAIGAIVGWMARNFPEAPFCVQKLIGKQWEIQGLHALSALLDRPNPFYSGALLWMATLVDFVVQGNAYWIKIRNGMDGVIQLWWVPESMMEPKSDRDGVHFITHYEYKPGGRNTTAIRYEVSDIVHFRWGLDPNNIQKGMAPIRSLLREIFTDDEAAGFTAALLRNLGVPGVIITPDSDDSEIDDDTAATIREDFNARFTNDGRGGPMVLSGKAKVQILSFSPDQMNLRDVRKIPEERASAVLGIPAVVVGLGAGLDRSTFNNMGEAREAAYENGLIPIQRLLASTVDVQLLPDFEPKPGWRTAFDTTQVRVLQDDADKKASRVDMGVRGGYVDVFEGRQALGLDAKPEHHYFLRPVSVVEVPTDHVVEEIVMPDPVIPPPLPAGPGEDPSVDPTQPPTPAVPKANGTHPVAV